MLTINCFRAPNMNRINMQTQSSAGLVDVTDGDDELVLQHIHVRSTMPSPAFPSVARSWCQVQTHPYRRNRRRARLSFTVQMHHRRNRHLPLPRLCTYFFHRLHRRRAAASSPPAAIPGRPIHSHAHSADTNPQSKA